VPVDIHPDERTREMEGDEANAEVACLAGWRATKDSSPRFLSCDSDEQEKGGGNEICSASMHMGNYEPEAALVEPGVQREKARRKGINNDWGAPGSTGPVRACEQEPEREREQRDERREASAASRSSSPIYL
jgi:hypothetical protein